MLPSLFLVSTHLDAVDGIVTGLRSLLQALADGKIPAPGYDEEVLRHFCVSAVEGQRANFANFRAGSWAVIASGDDMPPDARVDLVFVPTYLVVAILSHVCITNPALASAVPGFKDALRRGMLFASCRQLEGHEYGALLGMCEAVELLGLGRVPELLRDEPELAPELWQVLRRAKGKLAEALESPATDLGGWGSGRLPRERVEAALRGLRPVADE